MPVGRLLLILVSVTTLLLSSSAALAREMVLGLNQALTGDSNLFSTAQGRQPDGSYQIGPTIRFREDRDDVRYNVFYNPTYRAFMVTPGINAWSHVYSGDFRWLLSPRDEVRLDSRAFLTRNVTPLADAAIVDPGANPVGIGDVGRYTVDLTWTRSFSDRLSGSIGGRYEQWTFSDPRNTPNISGRGTIGTQYQPFPRWAVGLSADGTYRRFDAVLGRPPLRSTIVAASVQSRFQATESVEVTASIGPSYVRQRQDEPGPSEVQRFRAFQIPGGDSFAAAFANCVPNSDGDLLLGNCGFTADDFANGVGSALGETTLASFRPGEQTTSISSDFATLFMSLTFTRVWPRGVASIGYVRTQDATGGISSTSVADIAQATTDYQIDRRTTFRFLARYVRRSFDAVQSQGVPLAVVSTEVSDAGRPLAEAGDLVLVTGRNVSTQDVVVVRADLIRRLSKNLSIQGQFIYNDVFTDGRSISPDGTTRAASESRFTRFVGRVILRFEFDPYRF